MATKLLALYRRPEDEAAFLDHYENVHLPLVRAVPHLERIVLNRVTGSPTGETPWFLIAEMHFADRAAFDAAMQSPENKAAGRDLRGFAGDLVTLLVAED